jgi:ubiquinone/menaquinone biosynthesis C-methylase UbiE
MDRWRADLENESQRWTPKGDGKLIYEFLSGDTSRQTHGLREALRALDRVTASEVPVTLLDLGCGDGGSYDVFSARSRKVRWVGMDVVDSQEVISRPLRSLPFCAYDGIQLPLRDNSVDIVYSRQVFEHVRHPERVMAEVYRVMKPDSFFVGSTSHLEPFHSRSYWNYTPYGFCVLLREAGFRSIEVRPGIDSFTLIGRRYLSYIKLANLLEPFFTVESPMNAVLEAGLRLLGQPTKRRNSIKLVFAGQFCFLARK